MHRSSTLRTAHLSFLGPLLIMAGLALVPACTTAGALELVPDPVIVDHQNPGSVRIFAKGSGRSYGIGARKVGSTDLEQAVRTAVLEAGLFQEVALSGVSDWLLEVTVERISISEPGLSMTSKAQLRWRLVDNASDRVRWESSLSTEGDADPDDSPDFGTRGRIAMERAMAENLADGVRRLGSLVL